MQGLMWRLHDNMVLVCFVLATSLLVVMFDGTRALAQDMDNMCYMEWAGLCKSEEEWTAGWYVYQYSWDWTVENRPWLAAALANIHSQLPQQSAGDMSNQLGQGDGGTAQAQPGTSAQSGISWLDGTNCVVKDGVVQEHSSPIGDIAVNIGDEDNPIWVRNVGSVPTLDCSKVKIGVTHESNGNPL